MFTTHHKEQGVNMAQLGLDTEAMGTLQKSLERDASTIASLTKQLNTQLRAAWWKGPDADKFRAEWEGTHRAQLDRLSAALGAAAKVVGKNITQQTQASAS